MSLGSNEKEFRLHVVVDDPEALESVWSRLACGRRVKRHRVLYLEPHFRFKHRRWEAKRVVDSKSVYHDGVWFKWFESIETPFPKWTRAHHKQFCARIVEFQNPFVVERRRRIRLDREAVVYRYDKGTSRGLVFEWEVDALPDDWRTRLGAHAHAYRLLDPFPRPSNPRCDPCARKPVAAVDSPPPGCLVAHKYDGVFGLVYSRGDSLLEVWEGDARRSLTGGRLPTDCVFAAERVDRRTVVLLDVYRAHGSPVAEWSRRSVLTECLPRLRLPPGYRFQVYRENVAELPPPHSKTDGYVFHDPRTDEVYKTKRRHTLDLMHENGHFLVPNDRNLYDRVPCRYKRLRNGFVYEVTPKGRVLRRRRDRFRGNTHRQLENVYKCIGGKPSWMTRIVVE